MVSRRITPAPRRFASRYSRRAALRAGLSAGVATALAPAVAPAMQATPVATPTGEHAGAPVRVLTVTMYQDPSRLDDPLGGEASRWLANHQLDDQLTIPGSASPVYCDASRQHCLAVTGMGPVNAAATMMAVGLNGQLDLSQAYILIAGIGGVAPSGGTLGSAAWAEWVVDASTANFIDPRELPSDWLYPFFHLGCTTPWCEDGFATGAEAYQLDSELTAAAYEISKGIELADTADAEAFRATYSDESALVPPGVLLGDVVASPNFPSGNILSDYMAWWMRQWSGGLGTYVMSSNEDIGTLTALRRLADAGLVDWRRIMLVRAGSDFDRPAPGQTALAAIEASDRGGLPIAYEIALENAYRAGSEVARQILDNWESWQAGPPAAG